MKTRLPILLVLLLAAAPVLPAQQKSGLLRAGEGLIGMLTAPSKSLDSAYVLQPRLKWMVSLDGSTIRSSANLDNAISLTDYAGSYTLDGRMQMGMQNRLCKKVGLSAGYSILSFGYGLEVGKKGAERNTYFSLGFLGSSYALQVQYYKTHQGVTGTLSMDGSDVVRLSSSEPGELRNFCVDGLYAFNRHHFVYSAAYSARILQRRSTGSWVFAGKYLQGDFSIDPSEADFTRQLNGLHRYSTLQVSLGGGYSFNWVLFHRDPVRKDNSLGLRNLTLNATLLADISFLNDIWTEQLAGDDTRRIRYMGHPSFAPSARGAVCWAWDRFFVNLQATYDRFSFRGADTEVNEDAGRRITRISTRGAFYDLTTKLRLGVRF